MKNAGRAGIVPKDDFDINVKYKRLDAVMYDKSLYIAKKDVPLGTLPTDTTYWMKSINGNKEPIATTDTAGVVKPDGETITIDEDGTLHGQSKVNEMTGATADKDGTSGTVPVPKAGQEDLFLRGDGTWREAGTNITVDSELSKESTNPIENRAVAEKFENKLNSDGDSKYLTTTFTSNDSTNVTEWTDVGLLTSCEKHSSLFQKVSTMFKNIRYLYHMLGTADISTLGEGANIGTVTGALSKLNSDLGTKPTLDSLNNSKISYTKSAKIKNVIFFSASIVCEDGKTLNKAVPLAHANFGANEISSISLCIYRNTATGFEKPGYINIKPDGNIYPFETDNNYNEIRIECNYVM